MNQFAASSRSKGFTLVELLVVIAIIGVLIGLLLPAVQAARTAARRTATNNKLRQLGQGCHNFMDSFLWFPWPGSKTAGDKNDAVGQASRDSLAGSWAFMILPFIEEQATHDKFLYNGAAADREFPVAAFLCPQRGRKSFASQYITPGVSSSGGSPKYPSGTVSWSTCGPMTDFAMNARLNGAYHTSVTPQSQPNMKITAAKVQDGLSKTILLGAKYVGTTYYDFPNSSYDECAFTVNGGANRTGWYVLQDNSSQATDSNWGSPFPACPFVMCDGAVKAIEVGVNIYSLGLTDPKDGKPVENINF